MGRRTTSERHPRTPRTALFAVQRIEHGSMQDPRRDEEYCGRGVCAKMSGHPGRCGV
ncbi:hypothetical protein SEA_ECLIPTUS_92 [Gordonia phage Ecliptus]|nr:hypothetical protein SEA_ECLIPTUS_92 [Gordonia phage Ecliptus]